MERRPVVKVGKWTKKLTRDRRQEKKEKRKEIAW